MKSYPLELRQQVIAACDAGHSTELVAKQFAVSPAWVRRLKQHRRERGDIAPRSPGGSRGRKIDRDRLAQLVAEQPGATLTQLRDGLGITVTPWAISKALRILQIRSRRTSQEIHIPLATNVVENPLDIATNEVAISIK